MLFTFSSLYSPILPKASQKPSFLPSLPLAYLPSQRPHLQFSWARPTADGKESLGHNPLLTLPCWEAMCLGFFFCPVIGMDQVPFLVLLDEKYGVLRGTVQSREGAWLTAEPLDSTRVLARCKLLEMFCFWNSSVLLLLLCKDTFRLRCLKSGDPGTDRGQVNTPVPTFHNKVRFLKS